MEKKAKRYNRGFTLIEVMVVIIIMGFLAAIAVPIALGAIERSRENIDRVKLFYLREALNRALVENEDALTVYTTVKPGDAGNYSKNDLNTKLINGVGLFILEIVSGLLISYIVPSANPMRETIVFFLSKIICVVVAVIVLRDQFKESAIKSIFIVIIVSISIFP